LKKRPDVKIAKFDVVLLVEFETVDAARDYQHTPEWITLMADAKENSHN
jgi:uncharacterized protein (DUF1330 family)